MSVKKLQMNTIPIFLVLIISLLTPLSATALNHWTGNSNNLWSKHSNWTGGAPAYKDIVSIRGSHNMPVKYDSTTNPSVAYLTVDEGSQIEMPGNDLTTMAEIIGDQGEGTFTQNGGTHQAIVGLALGRAAETKETWYYRGYTPPRVGKTVSDSGGTGRYILNGGTLEITGDEINDVVGTEIIGVHGSGVFTQNGGTHNVNGRIVLGQDGYSSSSRIEDLHGISYEVITEKFAGRGAYILNGGTLRADTITKGSYGYGKLVIDGGTLSVTTGNIKVDDLIVGNSVGSDGYYAQTKGTVKAEDEIIGKNGKGTYVQSGGTHDVLNFSIGNEGTYELSGSGVLSTTLRRMEIGGSGTFNLSGGTHNAHLITLYSKDSVYNITGGHLNASFLDNKYSGTFNQHGGTVTTDRLELDGEQTAHYNLTDGTLIVTDEERISYHTDSAGVFTQSGGTHRVEKLIVGSGMSPLTSEGQVGHGTYILTGGSLTAVNENIGTWGVGTFIQDGGTHVIENEFYIGFLGYGTYTLNGGTLSTGELLCHGILSIDGGSLNLDTGKIASTEFYVGEKAGYHGSYTHSKGTITVETEETIGNFGTGTFTQDGGSHTVQDRLFIGRRGSGEGTFTLLDGELSVETRELIGWYGTGTFIQNGGTHTVGTTLCLGFDGAGQGTYTLNGGELNAGQEQIGRSGNRMSRFAQTGGTNTISGNLAIKTTSEYTQTGGTLNTAGIINSGQFTSSSGTLMVGSSGIQNSGDMQLGGSSNHIGGSVSNSGTMEIKSATTFTGDITNTGRFKTAGTAISVNGTYSENAAFISNGSSNTVDTLVVNKAGYLKGGAADEWIIQQHFENQSLENLLWDTGEATLTFSGNTAHEFYIAGADLGANMAGYQNNFAWDCLNIEGTLSLFDGNTTPGGALYLNTLTGIEILGGTITNILFGDSGIDYLNIYYLADLIENDFLGGRTYSLTNGGSLIGISAHASVPVPGTFILLFFGMLVVAKNRREKG